MYREEPDSESCFPRTGYLRRVGRGCPIRTERAACLDACEAVQQEVKAVFLVRPPSLRLSSATCQLYNLKLISTAYLESGTKRVPTLQDYCECEMRYLKNFHGACSMQWGEINPSNLLFLPGQARESTGRSLNFLNSNVIYIFFP